LIVPQLTVLPLDRGGYALTYTLTAAADGDIRRYYVDAGDGRVILEHSDVRRQAPAVGRGRGVFNNDQKLSVASLGGSFVALDLLRPARLLTFDLKGNPAKALALFNGLVALGDADVAADADNNWTDGAVVDAHAYAGYVYDYFFKRFGRRSWDDRNLRIPSLVHPVRREDFFALPQLQGLYFANAFFCCEELGGFMVYGEGTPVAVGGKTWNRTAGGLDVVAHEITHGMTAFASGLDNRLCEAGGLNEAFSDMMGVSVDFFHRPTTANYRIGEEIATPGGIRDMANPAAFGDPDHVAVAFFCEEHYLAGMANQAFYLAIEGGRNRTSGMTVQGVGPSNRDQIERVFYRAFTFMLTPSARYIDAVVATVLSARQLYGTGSAVERAVVQAWVAVGF
jgi:Zn-dependent metalloprotease